jgi:hypothetical protein
MEFGGIIIALSALLWLAYLLPTWLRRRQYLATERNAVRLQQTLRVLAETAEVPDEVRAEASARSVAEQQRALRRVAEEAEAAARARDAAAARALPKVAPQTVASPTAAVRLRRTRLTATGVLALALVGILVGIGQVASAGVWGLLVVSSIAAMLALAGLQRMSRIAQARKVAQAPVRRVVRTAFPDFGEQQEPQAAAPVVEAQPWTPVPVPKPLYLSRTAAPAATAADDSTERELAAAIAAADRALRQAHQEPEVAQLPVVGQAAAEHAVVEQPAAEVQPVVQAVPAAPVVAEAPAAPLSRFARMGIVGDAEPGMADLDTVLRRRRRAS